MHEPDVRSAWKLFAHDGVVTYFAKGGRSLVGGRLDDEESLVKAAKNLEEKGYNVYLGANPSNHRGVKAKARDITYWRRCVIDLDPTAAAQYDMALLERGPTCLRTLGDCLVRLLGGTGSDVCPVEAITLVYSGRGYQAWLELVPSAVGSGGREIERGMVGFLGRLAAEWGDQLGLAVDISTSDLSRVVRCPGTKNTKTGREARILTVGTPAPLAAAILSMAGEAPPEPTRLNINVTNLEDVWAHLNRTALSFIMDGAPLSRRHHDAYAAAKNLEEIGVSQEVATEWVTLGGARSNPPLPAGECAYAVKAAWLKGRSSFED
jgi:hypothetical protein